MDTQPATVVKVAGAETPISNKVLEFMSQKQLEHLISYSYIVPPGKGPISYTPTPTSRIGNKL